jgi:hypothetical protein
MIRRVVYLLLYIFISITVFSQKYEVKGKIFDKTTNQPLISAIVKVRGLALNAISDEDGNYSIKFNREGVYFLTATYVGYGDLSLRIRVESASQSLNFVMEDNLLLDEVVVRSKAPDERIKSLSMGVEKLTADEIKIVPALMGEVDVLKVVQLLPGVQAAAEGTSGFSVRGGSPDQNLITIDNTTVYNVSHLLGFFSIFNNDVLSGVDLYKGDIPIKYGGRLSSLLDVRTKTDQPEKLTGAGGIGLISSRLVLEGPTAGGRKTSWLIGGRRSYADLFLKLSSDKNLRNSSIYFYDLNAKFAHRLSDGDFIDFNGYYGKDKFGSQPGVFYYTNGAGSLTWQHVFSRYLSSKASFNLTTYDYGLESKLDGSEGKWVSGITDYMLRFDLTHGINDLWNLNYGLTSVFHKFKPGYVSMPGVTDFRINETGSLEHGIYISNEQKLSEKISLKYGTRLSVFQNTGKAIVYQFDDEYRARGSKEYKPGEIYNTYTALEPRAGIVWKIDEASSIKANYVHNVQFIQLANNSAAGSPLDVWFTAGPNIKPQTVDMISVGYFRNLNDNMYETSVEAYYKDHKNVIDFAEHSNLILNDKLDGEIRTGAGKSYGTEFMVRKNKGHLTGFINYTLSRSERTIPEINKGKTYLSPYDKTHSLNIAANYALSKKITISAIWVYATGNPTTYPSGRFEIDGEYFPLYSGRNEHRRPDYHRLDLSLTYVPKPDSKKRWHGEWNVSFYNAYAKKNPWMITYSQNEDTGLPYAEMIYLFGVVPSITYNFKF